MAAISRTGIRGSVSGGLRRKKRGRRGGSLALHLNGTRDRRTSSRPRRCFSPLYLSLLRLLDWMERVLPPPSLPSLCRSYLSLLIVSPPPPPLALSPASSLCRTWLPDFPSCRPPSFLRSFFRSRLRSPTDYRLNLAFYGPHLLSCSKRHKLRLHFKRRAHAHRDTHPGNPPSLLLHFSSSREMRSEIHLH